MQSHPSSSIQAPATSCGLATASLVCGICGLFLGPFTGIPAIITGHMALGRIKKSGGGLRGGGMALAGLILGYIFTALLLILAAAGFAAGNAAIMKAKRVTTLATAVAIETAVNNYVTEYGTMPSDVSSDMTQTTSTDTGMLEVLLGLEGKFNTRSIKFLSVKEGRGNKNGLVYSSDGNSVAGLYDPWGGGYNVRLDLDSDEKLNVVGETLDNRRVVVWSDGPDRKAGTQDDVKTW
jgi:hypothetical protein